MKQERFSRRAKIVATSGLAAVLVLAVVLVFVLGGSSPSIESQLSTYTHWCKPFTSNTQGNRDVSGSANCGLSAIIFELEPGMNPDQFGTDNGGTGEWVAVPQASGLYLIRPTLGNNVASALAIMKAIPGSYVVNFSGGGVVTSATGVTDSQTRLTAMNASAACNTDVRTDEVGVQAYYANNNAFPRTIASLTTGTNAALRRWASHNSYHYYYVGLVTARGTVSYITSAGATATVHVTGAALGGVYVDAGNPVPAPGTAANWHDYDTYVAPSGGTICWLA
jgi:hypothetical protein